MRNRLAGLLLLIFVQCSLVAFSFDGFAKAS